MSYRAALISAPRTAAIGVAVLAVLAIAAQPAHAVVCGKRASNGRYAVGALSLRKDPSTVTHAFGRDTGTESLGLYFSVRGCTLPRGRTPVVALLPANGADHQLKRGFTNRIRVRRVSGRDLNILISVVPKRFKPGSYGALAQVTAPYLAPSLTPVGVSRSEDKVWLPVLIGALGGVVGLLLAIATNLAAKKPVPFTIWFVFVAVAALVAGAVGGWGVYHDQDIWRMADNWRVTAAAGVTAATTGSMVAVIALLAGPVTAQGGGGGGGDAAPAPAPAPSGDGDGGAPQPTATPAGGA